MSPNDKRVPMLFDEQLEDTLEHIHQASARLPNPERDAEEPSARTAAVEHLKAAERELSHLRMADAPQIPQIRTQADQGLADRILGLITLLSFQMAETTRALEPLRPTGGRPPLQRVRDADLEPALTGLRRLRKQVSGIEAGLRQLRRRLRPSEPRLN